MRGSWRGGAATRRQSQRGQQQREDDIEADVENANPNAARDDGKTALHLAADLDGSALSIIAALLASGAVLGGVELYHLLLD